MGMIVPIRPTFIVCFFSIVSEEINLPSNTIDTNEAHFLFTDLQWQKLLEIGARFCPVDQRWECIQENKNKKIFFFSWTLSWSRACFLPLFSCFLDRFLGRVLIFLLFFYKFPSLLVREIWLYLRLLVVELFLRLSIFIKKISYCSEYLNYV